MRGDEELLGWTTFGFLEQSGWDILMYGKRANTGTFGDITFGVVDPTKYPCPWSDHFVPYIRKCMGKSG